MGEMVEATHGQPRGIMAKRQEMSWCSLRGASNV